MSYFRSIILPSACNSKELLLKSSILNKRVLSFCSSSKKSFIQQKLISLSSSLIFNRSYRFSTSHSESNDILDSKTASSSSGADNDKSTISNQSRTKTISSSHPHSYHNDSKYTQQSDTSSNLNIREAHQSTKDDGKQEKSEEEKEFETKYPHWLSMERRVTFRKVRPQGSATTGRSNLRGSAWDAENV